MVMVSGCGGRSGSAEVDRALKDLNVVDESNLNDLMLSSADPNEAVSYFRRATGQDPGRIDLQRNLAKALVRAKQPSQAIPVWMKVTNHKEATEEDTLSLADALIRSGEWAEAERQVNQLPPNFRPYKRYRLEAMIADSHGDWAKADSFYETAVGLTNAPAGVLNNWGFSKLSRGSYAEAERLFAQSLSYEPDLFTAKNNIALARGAQRNYTLPAVQTTQTERAQLLHTLALAAIKQGDVAVGEGLLREAIETHPQHFDVAHTALEALSSNVRN